MPTPETKSKKQAVFREMVLGTLVYSVVLGFFNDYTDVLHTKSYSITFSLAIVMQLLTYFTFQLKGVVFTHFKQKNGPGMRTAMIFCIWLIMFLSKFVFLAVIGLTFPDSVEISGFFGLLAIILTMTIAKQLIDIAYKKLA